MVSTSSSPSTKACSHGANSRQLIGIPRCSHARGPASEAPCGGAAGRGIAATSPCRSAVQDLSDLLVGEPLEISQHDHLLEGRRQTLESPLDVPVKYRLKKFLLRSRPFNRRVLKGRRVTALPRHVVFQPLAALPPT